MSNLVVEAPAAQPARRGVRARLARAGSSDVARRFRHSSVAIAAVIVLAVYVAAAVSAPWIAPASGLAKATLAGASRDPVQL